MNVCSKCGFPIPPPNQAWGYAGPVCVFGGAHPTYEQPSLTRDELRQIVREEIAKVRKDVDAMLRPTEGKTDHQSGDVK